MANYGDNFREGPAYENNEESLFEVQFLDYGSQGVDDEWTPVNTSPNATQGHAIESNFGPGDFGGWADLSASPWLYHLFKAERTKNGSLDPRLYWTIGTYEPEWASFEYGNMCYGQELTSNDTIRTNNSNGGLPIAKWTNLRTGLYSTVIVGLRCGINLRLMRYSDVLLRAAECENEVHGVTDKAIEWINEVRRRANLNDLNKADFADSHELFEQIANVERPKEFGCEYGRGNDLIRWGFFYDANRLQQLKEHGTFLKSGKPDPQHPETMVDPRDPKDPVSYADKDKDERIKSSYDSWLPGHEFLPIYQGTLNANPNLKGNSANDGTDNSADFFGRGWTVHPVVNLSK
ncbi:MAG: RagB/SusD family nutrient uptake outer membrane protein, partial [Prevotella sp.]